MMYGIPVNGKHIYEYGTAKIHGVVQLRIFICLTINTQ